MRPQHFLFPFVGFALGVLVTVAFIFRSDSRDRSDRVPDSSRGDITASNSDYERRIAALKWEIESLRNNGASGTANPEAPYSTTSRDGPASFDSMRQTIAGSMERTRTKIRNVENDALLAAGFPLQRIEWLRRRSDELKTERERMAREGKVTDPNLAMAYLMDPDLDLATEIGEEEYDRYRRALGRPPGVIVDEVREGTPASAVGIKTGDVIIGYSGKRIYNSSSMAALVEARRSGGNVSLDVIRDGRTIQIVAPSGGLEFTSKLPMIYQMEHHEALFRGR